MEYRIKYCKETINIKMKIYPECGPCMLNRALLFCEKEDEETKERVIREVCRVFSEKFSSDISTTEMAYLRNRIIENITMDRDPMKTLKEESLKAAEKIYPRLEGYVKKIKDGKERFKVALKIALSGNIVEFGARDHKLDLNKLEEEIFAVVEGPLAVDDSERIYENIKNSKEILYVTDNAGELIFDKIFIKELQKYVQIFVAPLSKPVQDDAWIEDIKKAGIDTLCTIIPRGDFIGVWFEKCSKEFLKKWEDADFIIAKGMACYETLVDYPEMTKGKVALLMKAKCKPVARHAGVPLRSNVVKII